MTTKAVLRNMIRNFPTGKQLYLLANKARMFASRRLPDATYAQKIHLENSGRKLNLDSPELLSEKIWWLKLNNRDPLLRFCSDKVTAPDFVRQCGFEKILVPRVGVYYSIDEVPFTEFQEPVYLKMNNASGVNALYRPKEKFDFASFKTRFSQPFKQEYFWQSREWNYLGITPAIVAEQVIPDSELVDYRFLCFHGKVRLIFVDVETALSDGTHAPQARRNVYTPDFEQIPVTVTRKNFPTEIVKKPAALNEMITIAETLSAEFPLCRVDLYYPNSRQILFGEMTFYPGGGMQIASPLHYESQWGNWLDLSKVNCSCASESGLSHAN